MSGISFGMPSLFETKTVEQCAALCKELGLQFVELNANFPQFQPQRLDARELRRIAEEYGIFFTLHLHDDLNVADFNEYVAEACRKTVLETIALAKEAGMKVLNMHLAKGAVYTLPQRKVYFFREYLQEYLHNIRRFREECQEAIGSSDLRICVENCDGFQDFHRTAIELLLESDVFGLTMDVGHNYCAGAVDEDLILERKSRLWHMHIHDALDGGKDHRALGTGQVALLRFLDLARDRKCTAVLEIKTEAALRQSVNWLRQN